MRNRPLRVAAFLGLLWYTSPAMAAEIERGDIASGSYYFCNEADEALKFATRIQDELKSHQANFGGLPDIKKSTREGLATCTFGELHGRFGDTIFERLVRMGNGRYVRISIVQLWRNEDMANMKAFFVNVIIRAEVFDRDA